MSPNPRIQTPDTPGYKIGDHKLYEIRPSVFRFPFSVLDPTPGGQSLGRIEWGIEPLRVPRKRGGKYWIDCLLVWARQTRDERYAGTMFRIPCLIDGVTTHRYGGERASYFAGVWVIGYCAEHRGNVVFHSYPENNAVALIVDTFVSSATVYYENAVNA